jgi:hypothetical protein
MAPPLLASLTKGASYLVFMQLFSRLLTFTLNQLLLRFTAPEVLGLASIQLDLLSSVVLFLSREAFRCVLMRVPSYLGSANDCHNCDDDDDDGGGTANDTVDDSVDDSVDDPVDDTANTADDSVDDSVNGVDDSVDDSVNTADKYNVHSPDKSTVNYGRSTAKYVQCFALILLMA